MHESRLPGVVALREFYVGRSRYFQFEKLCDSDLGDQPVLLGYEGEVIIKSALSVRRPQVMELFGATA